MNRTTGIILYFIFVMTFLLFWDYFVLRPKREELLKQQTEKKAETVIKASPEPPLITLKSDGYEYLIDENIGAIYGLNDKRHKARVTGYIVKPLRDTQIFNLENLGNYRLKITLKEERPLQITLPITEDPRRERREIFVQYVNGKLKKFNYQYANQEFYTDSVRWIGLRSRYYMVSIWDFRGFVVSFKDGDRITLRLYPKGDKEFFVFFGPAEKRLLSMEPNMEKAFDLGGGWTTFLAWPIYWVLTFFEGLTKNYGIAIILLALFIKLLTSPLSFNMYKSIRKDAEIKAQAGKDPETIRKRSGKVTVGNHETLQGGGFQSLLRLPPPLPTASNILRPISGSAKLNRAKGGGVYILDKGPKREGPLLCSSYNYGWRECAKRLFTA